MRFKLPLLLCGIFVYTTLISVSIAAGLGSLGQRGAMMSLLIVIPPVFSGLLAAWITLIGKRPFWRIVGVLGACVTWEILQQAGGSLQGFAIPGMLYFATVAVPLLIVRGAGIVMIDVSAEPVGTNLEQVSVMDSLPLRWSLASQMSTLTGISVLLGLTMLMLGVLPQSTIDAFAEIHVMSIGVFFSLMFPLALLAILSEDQRVRRVAMLAFILVVIVGTAFFLLKFNEWLIAAMVVLMPTIGFSLGVGTLHLAGFRLLQNGSRMAG